jgi:hypothetical protein
MTYLCPLRGRMSAVVLFVSLLTSAFSAGAQSTPSESLVTSAPGLFDAEYSQRDARVTWVDSVGKLWVADIDRTTGLFIPTNGKGVLVDPDAMTTNDISRVGNGPEWLSTSGEDRIVYTKFVPGLPHTFENARLAMATRNPATASGTSAS